MTPKSASHRGLAVAGVVVLALIALLMWLLAHGGDADPAALPNGAATGQDPESGAATRAPRVRNAEEPGAPESPPAATPASNLPLDSPLDPKYPLEVTVLRSDGTPAADASILLFGPDDEVSPTASAHADALGVASLEVPDGGFRVVAWLGVDAVATEDFVRPTRQKQVTVRLGPAMTIRGCVQLADAAPEPAASVTLTAGPWFKSLYELRLSTKSNGDGRFEFPPLPLAGVSPRRPPRIEAITADQARGFVDVDPARPGAEVVVRLTPGFTIHARFVQADNTPVVAELSAIGSIRHRATAGADGRVALRLPEARYELVATRQTSSLVFSSRSKDRGGPWFVPWSVSRDLGVHESGAGDVDLGAVVLPAGKPVSGRVVDAAGAAAVAEVTLFLGRAQLDSVDTTADGRFELPEVGDQPHMIYADTKPTPGAPVPRNGRIESVRGGDSALRLVLDAELAIVFRFLSEADHKPLTCGQYSIRAKRHGTDASMSGLETADEETQCAVFEVSGPGSYDVEVNVAGYEPQRFESVEVAAGRPTTLDLLLRKKHE